MDVVGDGTMGLRRPGGSPLNVAYGLGRLGIETAFLTHIGVDPDGDAIQRHLADAHVGLVAGSIGAKRTNSAVASIRSDGRAEYVFDIEWVLPGFRTLKMPAWVHVGSISTFLKPGADSVERLLHSLSAGPTISYDPNIRPALVGEHSDALDRFERFVRLAAVVKLSDEDAAWLYPTLSMDFVIDRILSLGAMLVALTRGAAGARIATQHHVTDVIAPRVEVSDAIGAGDSFMATLIAELLLDGPVVHMKEQLERIGARAAAAAALTCQRAGAQPPTRAELDSALQPGARG